MRTPSRSMTAPADQGAIATCLATLERVAFWVAVILPTIYLPLVIAASVADVDPTPGLVLIAVHAGLLVAGHRYSPR